MKNALDEVDAAYAKKAGVNLKVSYAASSALMKQIEAGAPADVFVSAGLEWMDHGRQKGHQGRHAGQPARQQDRADRAERLEGQQRVDWAGLRSRQARR
jgi:hypothetical protein